MHMIYFCFWTRLTLELVWIELGGGGGQSEESSVGAKGDGRTRVVASSRCVCECEQREQFVLLSLM